MYEQEPTRLYTEVVHELIQTTGKSPNEGRLRKDLIAEAGLAAKNVVAIEELPTTQ